MEDIILIGGGGHCKSVIDVIELEGKYNIAGIIDSEKKQSSKILDYEVLGNDDEILNLANSYKNALITVGQIKSPNLRIELYELVKKAGFFMPSIVSPRSYISKYATLGAGTVIFHDVIINVNAKIGINCIINNKALIEHDCYVGNHCHISTNVTLNGGVNVKNGCFIGSHSVAKEGSNIKSNSVVSFGTLIK
jgi:sugar O-acyltransferase (sialic acid O-acetyltransferase NeuD family)